MDVAQWRRETRRRLLEERLKISSEERIAAGLDIERRLEELLRAGAPQVVAVYIPFKAEMDLRPMVDRLRFDGWTFALPAVIKMRTPLEFREWHAVTRMEPGPYNIPQPHDGAVTHPAIVIAPMVAFDRQNFRLGYGGGFYDMTLGGLQPRPKTIGIALARFELETIFPEPHDIPMDVVITEAGTRLRQS